MFAAPFPSHFTMNNESVAALLGLVPTLPVGLGCGTGVIRSDRLPTESWTHPRRCLASIPPTTSRLLPRPGCDVLLSRGIRYRPASMSHCLDFRVARASTSTLDNPFAPGAEVPGDGDPCVV